MRSIQHKRGATLSYACALTDDAGDPVDLTGYTVTAEVRSSARELVSTADVTLADQGTDPGVFTIEADAADTADWEAGALLRFDVRIESASRVDYTETVEIRVVDRMTDP